LREHHAPAQKISRGKMRREQRLDLLLQSVIAITNPVEENPARPGIGDLHRFPEQFFRPLLWLAHNMSFNYSCAIPLKIP